MYRNDTQTYTNVDFEYIESFYYLKGGTEKKILCPAGKNHPINLENSQTIKNNDFNNEDNDWDLKCYSHNAGKKFVFTFYLSNGENQIYDLLTDDTFQKYEELNLHEEL